MNGTTAEQAIRTGEQQAREVLDRLLKRIAADKVTGEAYIRILCSQGGIRDVRFAVEGR